MVFNFTHQYPTMPVCLEYIPILTEFRTLGLRRQITRRSKEVRYRLLSHHLFLKMYAVHYMLLVLSNAFLMTVSHK